MLSGDQGDDSDSGEEPDDVSDQQSMNLLGSPSLSVDIEFLMSLGFFWTDIAGMLNISRSTLYRKVRMSGLRFDNYTHINDGELDRVIAQCKADHPEVGEVMVCGHLQSKGIQVPRVCIRASIHQLDPFVCDNLKSVIRRRSYNVPGPNYVWHIDGNHELICWRIIIHGGIDGYSRVIVFLRPSTNNCAATVLSCFESGVSEYGLPNRVCSDLGGENVEV